MEPGHFPPDLPIWRNSPDACCNENALRLWYDEWSLLLKATQTTADLKGWQAWLQSKLGLFATKDYLEKSLKDTNERLKGLSQRHYDPKRVYITFQTEHAQRKCLKAVETGEERRDNWLRGARAVPVLKGGNICG